MFLADFSKRKDDDRGKQKSLLALSSGGLIGGLGTTAVLTRRRNQLENVALDNITDQVKKQQAKYINNATGVKFKPSSNSGAKVTTLASSNVLRNTVDKIDKLNKNAPKNTLLGVLGGATLGYGTYRGGKAVINKLRNKKQGEK